MPDTMALPLAQALLACLCAELAETISGPTCRCCLSPGPEPMDCCECEAGEGNAWVRVVRTYPTTAKFPTPSLDPTRCVTGLYAVELELGVYRCVHVVDEDGPPTCDERTEDTEKILDDAAALRRAVACCFTTRGRQMIVGPWHSIGPDGGCAGGAMTVTVEAGDCCPPATP